MRLDLRSKIVNPLFVVALAIMFFSAGYFLNSFVELMHMGGITEKRMNELTSWPCGSVISGRDDNVIRLLQVVYDLPETEHLDLDIKSVNECTFTYLLESDFQGVAKVIFDPDTKEALRVNFYNWADDYLWKSSRPSFTAFIFSSGKSVYVYDQFRGRLFEKKLNVVSSLQEIKSGVSVSKMSANR
jgi:hypothetical protein